MIDNNGIVKVELKVCVCVCLYQELSSPVEGPVVHSGITSGSAVLIVSPPNISSTLTGNTHTQLAAINTTQSLIRKKNMWKKISGSAALIFDSIFDF